MSRRGTRRRTALPVLALLTVTHAARAQVAATMPAPAPADPAAPASGWHVALSPYLWLAGIGGKVTTEGGRSASFNQSFGDVLSHLDAGLMLLGDVGYDRFVLIADFEYASLSAKSKRTDPVVGEAKLRATSAIGTAAGGYRVVDDPAGTLDLLAGVRVLSFDNRVSFGGGLLPGFAVNGGDTWADAVGGLRGIVPLGGGFALHAYGDAGGGQGSDLTWQVYGGLAYAIGQHLVANIGYRYLAIRHDKRGLDLDIHEHGPLLGLTYRF